MRAEVLWRRVHAWVSIVVALPLLLVTLTGVLLQVKKDFAWIQPAEQAGSGPHPGVSFDEILAACAALPAVSVRDWSDVQRLDFRPDKGLIKVTGADDEEIQIDAASGRVLQVARRRSDFIEALHDGAWFGGVIKRCVFLPAGLCLVLLWGTGVCLFVAPRWKRRRQATQGRPQA